MNTRHITLASPDPDRNLMQRAYRIWAPVYDLVCAGIFVRSRKEVVALASTCGREVTSSKTC